MCEARGGLRVSVAVRVGVRLSVTARGRVCEGEAGGARV